MTKEATLKVIKNSVDDDSNDNKKRKKSMLKKKTALEINIDSLNASELEINSDSSGGDDDDKE